MMDVGLTHSIARIRVDTLRRNIYGSKFSLELGLELSFKEDTLLYKQLLMLQICHMKLDCENSFLFKQHIH